MWHWRSLGASGRARLYRRGDGPLREHRHRRSAQRHHTRARERGSRKPRRTREPAGDPVSRRGTFDYVLCWGVLMHVPDVEGRDGGTRPGAEARRPAHRGRGQHARSVQSVSDPVRRQTARQESRRPPDAGGLRAVEGIGRRTADAAPKPTSDGSSTPSNAWACGSTTGRPVSSATSPRFSSRAVQRSIHRSTPCGSNTASPARLTGTS